MQKPAFHTLPPTTNKVTLRSDMLSYEACVIGVESPTNPRTKLVKDTFEQNTCSASASASSFTHTVAVEVQHIMHFMQHDVLWRFIRRGKDTSRARRLVSTSYTAVGHAASKQGWLRQQSGVSTPNMCTVDATAMPTRSLGVDTRVGNCSTATVDNVEA